MGRIRCTSARQVGSWLMGYITGENSNTTNISSVRNPTKGLGTCAVASFSVVGLPNIGFHYSAVLPRRMRAGRTGATGLRSPAARVPAGSAQAIERA
jgi:hypothetical protein